MNFVKVELQHEYFSRNNIEKFWTDIDNAKVSIWGNGEILHIKICGRKSIEKLKNIMDELFSLLFIYLGGFAKINKLEVDNCLEDTSQYVKKYDTFDGKMTANRVLCEINANTINQKILQNYRKLKRYPIYSMQYLVCNDYKHVVMNHKITLLLHVIDGVVPDDIKPMMRKEIVQKFKIKDKIGDYETKVYYLCKNFFFNYHDNNKCEILLLLETEQYEFIHKISNTRNYYSHFLSKDKNQLTKGDDMWIYFEILFYTIRLYLAQQIGISVNEDWIKEFLYVIHDWILDVKNIYPKTYKSLTYQAAQYAQHFNEWIYKMLNNSGREF